MDKSRLSGIRNRLFLSYSAILLAAVLVFVAILLQIMIRSSIDTSLQNLVQLTDGTISQVDNFLTEMDTVALSAASNPQLLTYYIDFSEDGDPSDYFSKNVMDYVDVTSMLANINGPLHAVDRISVYNCFGDYISSGVFFEDGAKVSEMLGKTDLISSWSSTMSQKDNRRIVLKPHADFWSYLPNEMLSILRPVSNIYADVAYGVVEVQRDFSKFKSILNFSNQQDIVTVIFDSDGEVVYSTGSDDIDYKLYTSYLTTSNSAVRTVDISDYRSGGFMAYGKSSVANWNIAMLQSREAMLAPYGSAFAALIIGALMLSMVFCIVIFVVADRLSYPIRMLSNSIRGANLQNFTFDLPDADRDEVHALDAAFKALFIRLSQSTSLELQSYMLALQSQMNPHFLYNMLAVISAAGQEIGNDKIVDICAGVSSMLRYTASHSEDDVTIRDELNHARAYLELMKQRYEDDFSFSIEADESAAFVKVPKLILQPIVENCFQHGFKAITPPWRIDVKAYLNDGKWFIRVTDNGSGMSDEAIDAFLAKLNDYRTGHDYPKLAPGGLGMLNTAIRLIISYEKNDTFTVSRSNTGGTVVIIGGLI